jgi:chromosome segregation ATPase
MAASSMSAIMPHEDEGDALALRVCELSSRSEQQRDEIKEYKSRLEYQHKLLQESKEIIRNQEELIIEREAQLQAQQAEIRSLRRQHAMDAEALRAASDDAAPKGSPARGLSAALRTPSPSLQSRTSPLRKQLQQAISDKVVLVRALQELTAELAAARAEGRRHAAAAERSLSTAWRLGQLGQLGLALLEGSEEDAPPAGDMSMIEMDD